MSISQPDFSELHFTDADIESISERANGVLAVAVRNLIIVTEAVVLGREAPKNIPACSIEFHGVSQSIRTIRKYDENGQPASETVVIADNVSAVDLDSSTLTFELEGRLKSPPAWIDEWIVKAKGWRMIIE
ncbi:hypothetical protein [Enhygromyxa salina]|uniref:Uncharacterized protein n=1 Tax=Enhygromyxa salina TaxID=215803 RepID=A0A2S9YNC0_9BACT|nr:hypothetical protein [Enhygromyxa salina]PRQ06590.1 hypothetical protein ENSA7_36930 [Enhygromyxa salina]